MIYYQNSKLFFNLFIRENLTNEDIVMALYLVQHGKSLPKDVDPERGLSGEGIADVKRIAEVAKGYGIHVSCIKHSGKKRALQTSEIFASILGTDRGIEETSGINPTDDVTAYVNSANFEDDLMLVGHLPFMEKLASFIITLSTDRPVFKFQNGGIVCLDKYPDIDTWVIKWTLMPCIN